MGGPGEGYDWPKSGHGIFIDTDDNAWLAGNDPSDHQVLKFTPDGKFAPYGFIPNACAISSYERLRAAWS